MVLLVGTDRGTRHFQSSIGCRLVEYSLFTDGWNDGNAGKDIDAMLNSVLKLFLTEYSIRLIDGSRQTTCSNGTQ